MAEEHNQRLEALKNLGSKLGLDLVRQKGIWETFEHPSLTCAKRRRPFSSFQRLEFLGDRIVGLVVADYLYKTFPDAAEGELSSRLSKLVCTETLARIAEELSISSCLKIQRQFFGKDNSLPNSVLADAMEAFVGFVHQAYGLNRVMEVIEKLWQPYYEEVGRCSEADLKDAKSRLQEHFLGRGLGLPVYQSKKVAGTDHDPIFEALVTLPTSQIYKAEGSSKRKAEHAAAKIALNNLG